MIHNPTGRWIDKGTHRSYLGTEKNTPVMYVTSSHTKIELDEIKKKNFTEKTQFLTFTFRAQLWDPKI